MGPTRQDKAGAATRLGPERGTGAAEGEAPCPGGAAVAQGGTPEGAAARLKPN